MHIFTYILYLITGNVVGIMIHAGYTFPFKPLNMQFPINELCGTTNNLHHELHHNTFNSNFSAATIIPDPLGDTVLKPKTDIEK
jgi:sterol desaturase/sphingolipid hydroxylase (fatty acid hydroxylase superfamily)